MASEVDVKDMCNIDRAYTISKNLTSSQSEVPKKKISKQRGLTTRLS